MLMIRAAKILHSTNKTMLGLFNFTCCLMLPKTNYSYYRSLRWEFMPFFLSLSFFSLRIFRANSISNLMIFNKYGIIFLIYEISGQKPKFNVDFRIYRKVFILINLSLSSTLISILVGYPGYLFGSIMFGS